MIGGLSKRRKVEHALVMVRAWDAREDVSDASVTLAHNHGVKGIVAFAVEVILPVGIWTLSQREEGAIDKADTLRNSVLGVDC